MAEVRGQNVFMRRVLTVHAVTMLFLLGGMFGLSMTAIELSKETKVGTSGSLVTPAGEPVTVASADMYVGPNGELRKRTTSDGRRLDGEEGHPVTVSTKKHLLELSARCRGDRNEGLASVAQYLRTPGGRSHT